MGVSELVVDVAKIKRAAHNAIALNILTYTLPHDIEVYMEEVLDVFLGELGQKKLKDYVVYCLRELAVNAKKANTNGSISIRAVSTSMIPNSMTKA